MSKVSEVSLGWNEFARRVDLGLSLGDEEASLWIASLQRVLEKNGCTVLLAKLSIQPSVSQLKRAESNQIGYALPGKAIFVYAPMKY